METINYLEVNNNSNNKSSKYKSSNLKKIYRLKSIFLRKQERLKINQYRNKS